MTSPAGIDEFGLIKHVFSPDILSPPSTTPQPELSVTKKFPNKPDGKLFKVSILNSIVVGHGLLSRAMWKAFRNPIHHQLAEDLRDSGLYTEQDCLDALGLLSHLFRRLDNSEPI